MPYCDHSLEKQVNLLETTDFVSQCLHGLAPRTCSGLFLCQPGPGVWFSVRRGKSEKIKGAPVLGFQLDLLELRGAIGITDYGGAHSFLQNPGQIQFIH